MESFDQCVDGINFGEGVKVGDHSALEGDGHEAQQKVQNANDIGCQREVGEDGGGSKSHPSVDLLELGDFLLGLGEFWTAAMSRNASPQ
jgi:hypothetical protein